MTLHSPCPYCGAARGASCRSLASGNPSRPHRARLSKVRRNAAMPPAGFLEGSKFKQPLFHGTSAGVRLGHSLKPDQGDEFGIYLSPSHRYARRYGSRLVTALVFMKKPLVVYSKAEISPRDLTRADVERLERRGYDGIVVRSKGQPPSEVVAFHGAQVWVTEVK